MSIYTLQDSCASCTITLTTPQYDPCVAEPVVVAPVYLGFINCDALAAANFADPAAPTLAELETLVASNKMGFRKVANFNNPGEETQSATIDEFTPQIATGQTLSLTFEDPYYDLAGKTITAWWNDKLTRSSQRNRRFFYVEKTDRWIVYNIASGYFLRGTSPYDASSKTNKKMRGFTLDLTWDDPDIQIQDYYTVAGLSDYLEQNY